MHSLIEIFYGIEPGILVAALGAEALIVTLIPTRLLERRWVKAIAAALCFFLLWGEITIIKHDREVSAAQHEAEMRDIFTRFAGLHKDIVDININSKVMAQTHPSNPDSLKRRALDLSSEMLEFLLSREVPPGYGQGGFGEGPFGGKPADTKAYDKETVDDYFKVFETRVAEIRDEFKKRGITDQKLDAEFSNTVNTYSIRTIAERIGTLARNLPE